MNKAIIKKFNLKETDWGDQYHFVFRFKGMARNGFEFRHMIEDVIEELRSHQRFIKEHEED